ncbi:MAG: Uma2 family endonuclease [Micromonosporaceae bacterium]
MTAAAVHPWWEFDGLLQTWRELDVPEGWRAEITEDGITMTPPPANYHNSIAHLVDRALQRGLPDEFGVYQTLGVAIPAVSRLYIPDLCVMRVEELHDGTEVLAEQVLLAVEITSKRNARHDRKIKTWHYAHGPVPLYLLIDRYDENGPAVTLFSEPRDGHYQRQLRVPFGESIDLPAPLGLTLETTGFPRG